jgi:hypothetical protein
MNRVVTASLRSQAPGKLDAATVLAYSLQLVTLLLLLVVRRLSNQLILLTAMEDAV